MAPRRRPPRPSHRSGFRRLSAAVAFTLLTAAGWLGFVVPAANAAIITPFATLFTTNTAGQILLRGNSNMSCSLQQSPCATARNGTGNNNNYAMIFTDVDSDASTFNSSTAVMPIPTGSSVLFAGLFWSSDLATNGGIVAPNASQYLNVKFSTPTSNGYQDLTASKHSNVDVNNPSPYVAYADVTNLVATGGAGSYGVANIQGGSRGPGYAGWSLIVAYGNPSEPFRNLTIFDGFATVNQSTTNNLTIPVSGFQTPPTGAVNTEVGVLSYEGDTDFTGDQLSLNGTPLVNAANPANNSFNSTVSEDGVLITDRNPNWSNLMAVDVDRFNATGLIGNNATSATLNLTTTSETYYPAVVTFATELYSPGLGITKTAEDLNGGSLEPGDILEYSLDIANTGGDASVNSVLTDAIPTNTDYVPGSLTVDGNPVTDAAGDDVGSYASGTDRITARVGSGATATAGGRLGNPSSATVTFQVRVDEGIVSDTSIVNVANATYKGESTNLSFSTASNTLASPVTAPRADVAVTNTLVSTEVQRGDDATFQLTVVNNGPKPAEGVVVTENLPVGMAFVSLNASAGSCTTSGRTATCTIGELAVGQTVLIDVVASTGANSADPSVTTASVATTTIDPVSSNNSATAGSPVNDAPEASNDSATADPNDSVSIDVLDNDSDPDGDTLTVAGAAITGTPHGTVAISGGEVVYTPNASWAGSDTISYTISDGRGGTDTATVTVTTRNAPPVAVDDDAATTEATAVDIAVLTGDTDPNIPGTDQTLSLVSVTQSADGTATILADGIVRFTPSAGFKGSTTFTYTVTDGIDTDTATVTVTVADAAPVAADDSATTAYDTTVDIDVLDNDVDDNGDTLQITDVDQPRNGDGDAVGSASVVGGQVRFNPPAGFSGVVTFDYTISDGESTSTATVTVTVENGSPSAGDDTASTGTGDAVTVDVLADDSDPNGDTLTVTGTSTPADGSVRVVDGGIRYTPNPGFKGTDTFTYTVSDGNGGTDSATVTVTVDNADPTAVDDERTIDGGGTISIPVLVNDSDENDDPVSIDDFQATSANGGTVTRDGDQLVYTAPAGFLGEDTFTYTITDGDGGTDTATVTITVVNTPPAAVADAVNTLAEPNGSVTIDVLDNDSDPNGDDLEIVAVTSGIGGTAEIVDGELVYTYDDDFAGVDTFTYTISDGRGGFATATVTVVVANQPPTAVTDTAETNPGEPVTVDVLDNDSDQNGDAFSLTTVIPPASGADVRIEDGQVVYTPAAGFLGTETVYYVLTDARGGISVGSIEVTVTNRDPVAEDDDATAGVGAAVTVPVLDNDTDPDGDTLTVTTVGTPTDADGNTVGTVTIADNQVVYTPPADFVGTITFDYTVSDGNEGTSTATVTVVVGDAAPEAADDTAATGVGQPVSVDVLDNDSDADQGSVLTITAVAGGLAGSTVVIDDNGTPNDPSDDTVRYTPPAGFVGTDTITYTISDGDQTATATVTVTVGDAAPVAVDDAASASLDDPLSIDVLDNDSDADPGSVLTIVSVSGGLAGSTVVIDDNGTPNDPSDDRIVYTPPTGFVGTDTFTYTISDGDQTATATVTVTVDNDAPVLDDPDTADQTVDVGEGLDPLDFGDPNLGDQVTVTLVDGTLPPGITLNEDGSFSGTPTQTGTYTFTVQACDNRTPPACTTQTVTVGVLAAEATAEPTAPTTAPTSGNGNGTGNNGGLSDTGAPVGMALAMGLGIAALLGGTLVLLRPGRRGRRET